MEVSYFGWSGITVTEGATLVGFDLFGDAVTWAGLDSAETIILCVTHGHPEHCGSLRRFLAARQPHDSQRIHLVSSTAVVAYISKGNLIPPQNLHCLQDGDRIDISDTRITAFGWVHMPLLPSDLGAKAQYLFHLFSHPIQLAQIALMSFGLPVHAPTLGFVVTFPHGGTVLNYAEGLHRLTIPREVEAVANRGKPQLLLFAVEPEDIEHVPEWIDMLSPASTCLYEAHRPWRELFNLPYVDLLAFAAELTAEFAAMNVFALQHDGQRVELDKDAAG